jgi:hypothetical protein
MRETGNLTGASCVVTIMRITCQVTPERLYGAGAAQTVKLDLKGHLG